MTDNSITTTVRIEPRRWLYGYVFYRQSRDSSIHRGFLQKSVAILTENNLIDFYHRVIAIIGETYFDYGEKALDMAWRDICNWPQPQLNQNLVFPLLGKAIKFPMPSIRNGSFIFTPLPSVLEGSNRNSTRGTSTTTKDLRMSASTISLDSRFLHTVPVYAPLSPIISKIWLLWELVLLGKPILVLSPSPSLSSDTVLALASLISPLEYKGDFRPFFTIHDSEFKIFSDDTADPDKTKAGLIIGGTNPYFFKALSHWENIVTLSGFKKAYKHNPYLQPTTIDPDSDIDESANRSVGLIEYADQVQANGYQTVFPSGSDLRKFMKKSSKEDTPEECFSFNEKVVRYHMHLRTTTFLAPLRHFFDRLFTSKASHFKPLSKLPLIGELSAALLTSIKTHLQPGRNVSEIQFYETFIATPTFKRWFNKKRIIANEKLASDYAVFLTSWKHTHSFEALGEMELINMYQDGMEQIKKESEILGAKGIAVVKSVLEVVVKHLDDDLQTAIKMKEASSSPAPPPYGSQK